MFHRGCGYFTDIFQLIRIAHELARAVHIVQQASHGILVALRLILCHGKIRLEFADARPQLVVLVDVVFHLINF